MNNKYNINELKLKNKPQITKIDDNNYISIAEYKKRQTSFFEVVFNNRGKEILLGRYINEFDNIKAMYKDGKILVYSDEFIRGEGIKIVDVKDLYDILDDTFYCVSKLEALNIFDSSIDSSYLKDKQKSTIRKDIEKKTRQTNSLK